MRRRVGPHLPIVGQTPARRGELRLGHRRLAAALCRRIRVSGWCGTWTALSGRGRLAGCPTPRPRRRWSRYDDRAGVRRRPYGSRGRAARWADRPSPLRRRAESPAAGSLSGGGSHKWSIVRVLRTIDSGACLPRSRFAQHLSQLLGSDRGFCEDMGMELSPDVVFRRRLHQCQKSSALGRYLLVGAVEGMSPTLAVEGLACRAGEKIRTVMRGGRAGSCQVRGGRAG